ncbi:MAG: tRNA-specific 2-thiouridylase MnmA, partial [Labilithrix sp.]|nr:tRNA-specific 2-thiouridylase MnmA [Labilithrix sp.]
RILVRGAPPLELPSPASRGVIRFEAPVRAVSRGQIAVFYDGDRVLGGARIC